MEGRPWPIIIDEAAEFLKMRQVAILMNTPPERISSAFRTVFSPTKYMFQAVCEHVKFLQEQELRRNSLSTQWGK